MSTNALINDLSPHGGGSGGQSTSEYAPKASPHAERTRSRFRCSCAAGTAGGGVASSWRRLRGVRGTKSLDLEGFGCGVNL